MAAHGAPRLGRPRRVEDDTVFAAMAEVLLRVGWSRLSLNLVAAEVGVTPAALRQRFGSKRDLLVAFHAWSTRVVRDAEPTAPSAGESPLDTLRAMIRGSVASTRTPERMLNAMSVFTMVGTDPELRRLTRQRFEAAVDRTASLLDEAIRRGEIAGADAEPLARQLQNCLLGAALSWSVSGWVRARRPAGDELVATAEQVLAPYLRAGGRRTRTTRTSRTRRSP
jgi:AcrR family transcriptional regulator